MSRARRVARALAAVAAVLALVWWVAAPLACSSGHTPLSTLPRDYGIASEEWAFSSLEPPVPLRAWWMPSAHAKAVVLMVHGGGGNRSQPYTDWIELAGKLTVLGYSVLAVDLRNHGESGDANGGAPTFGPDEANDVVAAMNEVGRRFPGTRFAGLGHSMGGQTLIYAASRDPRLEAIVSDSTFADVRSIVPRFAHAATGIPSIFFAGPFLWSAEWLHGLPIGRARAIDVIDSLAPRPILIIHDAADPIVPVEQARALAAAAPSAELWITALPDGGPLPEAATSRFGTHAKSYMFNREEYVRRVTGFFDRVFRET